MRKMQVKIEKCEVTLSKFELEVLIRLVEDGYGRLEGPLYWTGQGILRNLQTTLNKMVYKKGT